MYIFYFIYFFSTIIYNQIKTKVIIYPIIYNLIIIQDELIYSIVETNQYLKENDYFKNDPEMLYKFIIRRNIMMLGLEIREIFYKNIKNSHKNMKLILQDQFAKLRNHFA